MGMTRTLPTLWTSAGRSVALFAVLFSGSMLAAAYLFQFVGGMAPCQMCYWQRWAHWTVLAFGLAGVIVPRVRIWPWLIILALLASSLVAGFHAGVEYGWWEGPKACTGGGAGPTDTSTVFGALAEPIDVVDCSEPAWVMLGISMAGWNALASFGAFLLSLIMTLKTKT